MEPTGTVRLSGQLDREVSHYHDLQIIVTDRGYPIRTATAALFVSLDYLKNILIGYFWQLKHEIRSEFDYVNYIMFLTIKCLVH